MLEHATLPDAAVQDILTIAVLPLSSLSTKAR
jgi:hypothetical protein